MVLGKNILKALFLKGTSNVPQEEKKKKKYSMFELQGVAGKILLSKTVKMEPSFQFQGKSECWSPSGLNLKWGGRKVQKISKFSNPCHKTAKEIT